MILGRSVSNHHCRYLITLKLSGKHYTFLSTTGSVRTCVLALSFDAVCSNKLIVFYCRVLVQMCSNKFVSHTLLCTRTHSVCGNTA